MSDECPKCPPPGLPAWMGTFADLMSLLMCFFVLLLSFSEMDVLKFKQIAGSMKFAFGVQNKIEVKNIIEKPSPKNAPSNIAVVGRYIIQPKVIDHLSLKKKGASGEIQLTDSLLNLIGSPGLFGVEFDGNRYDCGNKLGFIEANLNFGLNDTEIKSKLRSMMSKL